MVATIKTKRLDMRPLSLTDEALVREVLTDSELMRDFGGPLEARGVQAWLAENLRRYEEDGFSYLAVFTQVSEEFIGLAGLLVESSGAGGFNGVAYIIKLASQGQGYGLEVLNGLVAYGRDTLKLTEIGAQIAKTNRASQKLIIAAGFQLVLEFQRKLADGRHAYLKYRKKLETKGAKR